MITLTRYTYEGKGIFRKLQKAFNNVDMPAPDEQELFDAEEEFERYLDVPDVCTQSIPTKSYFTEEGLERFEYELDTICYYADLYLPHSVNKKTIDYDGKILYKDKYQVVVPA